MQDKISVGKILKIVSEMVFLIESAPGLWGETVFPSPEESPASQDMWYPWSFVIKSQQHLLIIGIQLQ